MFFDGEDSISEPLLLKYWVTGEMEDCCQVRTTDSNICQIIKTKTVTISTTKTVTISTTKTQTTSSKTNIKTTKQNLTSNTNKNNTFSNN